MMNLKEVNTEIEKAEADLGSLHKNRDEILSRTVVVCAHNCNGKGCGEPTQIKELTYIQTYWYVEPHGCTGGDYWKKGEGNWICPECDHTNRLIDSCGPNAEEVSELKYLFKEIKDEK